MTGGELGAAHVGVGGHRPELQDRERLAVAADPLLAVDHAAGAVALHEHGDDGEHRSEQDERGRGGGDVEQPLHHAADAGLVRRLDVDQRQAGDRAEVDARAADVGEARRDDQVLLRLEVPREVADALGGQVVAARRHHGVGVEGAERVRHVVDAADDAQVGDGALRRAVGERDAHDAVAVAGLAGEVERGAHDGLGRAEQHDAVRVEARGAAAS